MLIGKPALHENASRGIGSSQRCRERPLDLSLAVADVEPAHHLARAWAVSGR
jgi:hypothetical protein